MKRTVSAALAKLEHEHPPVEPHPSAPLYVHACHDDRWTLQVRHPLGLFAGMEFTFRCRSRRHIGPCRHWWRWSLRGRLLDETSKLRTCNIAHAMFWTLTLDHFVRVLGREAANREIGKLWRRLHNRILEWCKRNGYGAPAFFWVREAHRDGFPHLHLVIIHPELAALLRARDVELEAHPEITGSDRTIAPHWLRDMAVDCGFGPRFDAQLARSVEALAGYASKVTATQDDAEIAAADAAANSNELAGELTKAQSSEVDYGGRHTRWYGSSRKFMPPRPPSTWTGWIEDEYGRRMGMQPKDRDQAVERFEDARGDRFTRETQPDLARERPVYEQSNSLAHWPTIDEACAYAWGEFNAPLVRAYKLRPVSDAWRFTRNAKAIAEREQAKLDLGVEDQPDRTTDNPAIHAAGLLKIAALARDRGQRHATHECLSRSPTHDREPPAVVATDSLFGPDPTSPRRRAVPESSAAELIARATRRVLADAGIHLEPDVVAVDGRRPMSERVPEDLRAFSLIDPAEMRRRMAEMIEEWERYGSYATAA